MPLSKEDREMFKKALQLGAFVNWLDKNYPIPKEYTITFEPSFNLIRGEYNGLVRVSHAKKTAIVEVNVSQPLKKTLISYAHEHCHMRQFIINGEKASDASICIRAEAWASVMYKKYTQEKEENQC